MPKSIFISFAWFLRQKENYLYQLLLHITSERARKQKMPIKAVISGFTTLLRKPQVLLPALIVMAISLLASLALGELVFGLLYQGLVYEILPETGIWEFPFALYQMYSAEINALIALLAVSFILQIWLAFGYARFVSGKKKKEGIFGAMAYATRNIKHVIAAFVFFGIASVFFLVIAYLLFALGFYTDIIAIALWVLFALLVIYIGIKLIMAVPIMAIEEINLKEALQKSWKFSEKHFWGLLLLLIAVFLVVSPALNFIGGNIADLFIDDLSAIAVLAIFTLIITAYTNLAIALYYVQKS